MPNLFSCYIYIWYGICVYAKHCQGKNKILSRPYSDIFAQNFLLPLWKKSEEKGPDFLAAKKEAAEEEEKEKATQDR